MDIVNLPIPYDFVGEGTQLSWREIRFGLVNELLDCKAPIAFAIDQVRENKVPAMALLDLAGTREKDPTTELVNKLVDSDPQCSDDEVRDKWLYLVLAWILENRHSDPDPFQRVEEVYGDFGYPEEVESFVRYMPMQGPDPGSREAAVRRLFERWKQYVSEKGKFYSAQRLLGFGHFGAPDPAARQRP